MSRFQPGLCRYFLEWAAGQNQETKMSRFQQSAGPFGPWNIRPTGFRFSPVANPYVNLVAGLTVDSVGRPVNPVGGVHQSSSATIAGRPHIGCCAECAAEYRRV